MEEPAFLIAVNEIVGGIEIEHDLLRRFVMRLQEDIDQQPLDRRRVVVDLVIVRRGAGRLSSSRFSADLPAAGAQPFRRAASLPTRTAITGSCRSQS